MQTQPSEKLSPLQKQLLKRWQKDKVKKIDQSIKDELTTKFDGVVLFDEPMSKHCYMKVGGPAEVYLEPNTIDALKYVVQLAVEHDIDVTFHGSGANTLVKDAGIKGFVVSVYKHLDGAKVLEKNDDYLDVEVEAGFSWNKLVHLTRDEGFSDIACLTGIPGSLGGLIKMNAGTREKEMKDIVREVTVLNKDGELQTIARDRLDFQYRNLKITSTQFIVKAVLRFTQKETPEAVQEKIKTYQARRQDTQPLEYPNLGSIFKNPKSDNPNVILGTAGQLIEDAGLKNVRVGGARISPKHANFIINEGGATAKDILTLVQLVKTKVKEQTGLVLETEIKVKGDDPSDN